MLQHVAVYCSVLQCIAVCRSVLQCVTVCCSVLQRVAACSSMLQCVAACCIVLQCESTQVYGAPQDELWLLTAGSFKIRSLLQKELLKRENIQQKRLALLTSLRFIATPHYEKTHWSRFNAGPKNCLCGVFVGRELL